MYEVGAFIFFIDQFTASLLNALKSFAESVPITFL